MRKFLFDGVLFGVLFIMLTLLASFLFAFESPLLNTSFQELEELDTALENEVDVLLFGSSVNRYSPASDLDTSSIAQMIDLKLPHKKVVGISHSAYHLEVFYSFVKRVAKSSIEAKPLLVIPINLRNFSPEWDLKPWYQFIRERNLAEYGALYPFFSNYKEVTYKTFHFTEIFNGDTLIGTIEQLDKPSTSDTLFEQKIGFIYHYMQPIKKANKELEAIKRLVILVKKNDLKVLFYITPIDYDSAIQSIGKNDFDKYFNPNLSRIKSEIDKMNLPLLDLSKLCKPSEFHYFLRPNEHLYMAGRQKVAQNIANWIVDEKK